MWNKLYNGFHNVCKILPFIFFNSMKWSIFDFLNENNLFVFLNWNNHVKFWYFLNNFFFKLTFFWRQCFFYVNHVCSEALYGFFIFVVFDFFHSYGVHNGRYEMTFNNDFFVLLMNSCFWFFDVQSLVFCIDSHIFFFNSKQF